MTLTPYIDDGDQRIYHGDCIDVMRELDAASVSVIITDPPYGLEFMGKDWDRFRRDDAGTNRNRGEYAGTHGELVADGEGRPACVGYGGGKRATTSRCTGCGKRDQYRNAHQPCGAGDWRTEIVDPYSAPPTMLAFQEWCRTWAIEALRVLKPGGHLLAFGGTRTYHRLAAGLEDAGFEIRDCLTWLYGQGYPKSLDVSKAIDKRGGNAHLAREVGAAIKQARIAHGVTIAEADARYCGGSTLWTWYEGRPAGQQLPVPAVMEEIARDWPELAKYVELIAEADRDTIGRRDASRMAYAPGQANDRGARELDITTPATDAARQWEGWGTALKPAWEPIILARAPFATTVSANVLEHGTGALNVKAARIAVDPADPVHDAVWTSRPSNFRDGTTGFITSNSDGERHSAAPPEGGRWPANLVLDESAAAELDAQAGTLTSGANPTRRGADAMAKSYGGFAGQDDARPARGIDAGGASRFFYTAKASTSERNHGLDLPAVEHTRYHERAQGPLPQQTPHRPQRAANHHPTVKPLALMRWLVRLATPPGGVLLDPFLGSGTTLLAARAEGVRGIGIELDPEYLPIAAGRLAQLSLFALDGEAT